ncbi:hypothetical protein F5887DRAFT_913078 [Amanita rubescens]|nr:hypothetical protein F5887DRAFT_913078 [Amanita rubescens]
MRLKEVGGTSNGKPALESVVINDPVEATVVTASEDENHDLFLGIRGGGCNSVVTRFVLRLHPQRRSLYAASSSYLPSLFESVFDVLKDLWPKTNKKSPFGIP